VFIFSHSLSNASNLLAQGLLTVTLGMIFQAFISVKLKHINAQISALLLGSVLNHETLTNLQLSGIILVLIGLGIYEYGGKIQWIKK
jgi:drug/metabolite transporter (DMT)-like permease